MCCGWPWRDLHTSQPILGSLLLHFVWPVPQRACNRALTEAPVSRQPDPGTLDRSSTCRGRSAGGRNGVECWGRLLTRRGDGSRTRRRGSSRRRHFRDEPAGLDRPRTRCGGAGGRWAHKPSDRRTTRRGQPNGGVTRAQRSGKSRLPFQVPARRMGGGTRSSVPARGDASGPSITDRCHGKPNLLPRDVSRHCVSVRASSTERLLARLADHSAIQNENLTGGTVRWPSTTAPSSICATSSK